MGEGEDQAGHHAATGIAIQEAGGVKTIYDPRYEKLIGMLRERRRELGLTQEEVSRVLRVSRTWVSKIETRERRMDVLELIRLAKLYDLRVEDLVKNLKEEGP